MATATAKIDPFKTKKTSASKPAGGKLPGVQTPASIADAVDAYRDAQDKVKHFEGEAALYKDTIMAYSRITYAARARQGETENFKLHGQRAQAMYIVMDKSSALTEEDADQVRAEFGDAAAAELTEKDFRTLKFNAEVLEANYDAVVKALQTLPADVLGSLFVPMTLKTTKDVVSKAAKYTKSDDEMQRLMEILKITNYIR